MSINQTKNWVFRPLTKGIGVALVLAAGVFWSTMPIGIRMMENANVWQILFYRSLSLSLFLFFVIAIRSNGRPVKTIKQSGIAGVVGGIGLVMAYAGGVYSVQVTTVANAVFLFASAPFFAALLGLILLKEKVRTQTWIAIFLALCGITVMVRQGLSVNHLAGNLAALIAALGFAIFTIALRWKRLQDMLPAVWTSGIFCAGLCAAMMLANGYSFELSLADTTIAISMGVFQLGLGLVIYTIGSTVVPAVELTLLSMTEVLLAPLWVWIFIGETASINTLIGGSILLSAIVWNALSGISNKARGLT